MRRKTILLLGALPVLGLLAAAVAGSPMDLLNSASPDEHYRLTADVAYGDDERQRLDVYEPVVGGPPGPLVVFFYGGGWRNGDKDNYEFVASALTAAGMTVVIPDYRLYPDVRFPAFIEDGATAVAWSMQNANRFGADANAVFVMGHSAGAHIAATLAYDRRYMNAEPVAQEIAGFVGLSGPYDFLPFSFDYLDSLFPEENRALSQPVNLVTPKAPPTLLIHGTADKTVRPSNSESLERKLRSNGVPVDLKTYDDIGHARVVAALAPPLDFLAGTLDDTVSFVDGIVSARRGPKLSQQDRVR